MKERSGWHLPSEGRFQRQSAKWTPTRLRIVAGQLGRRYIDYNGDPSTRPMKEKTREAVFSLLGGYLPDTYAIDLFAGTGILGFESISRGSMGAVLLELARPAISTMLANMRALQLERQVLVHQVDSLRWLKNAADRTAELPRCRWLVFCCPPYALWQQQSSSLEHGLRELYRCMPIGSQLICEFDDNYDLVQRLAEWDWQTRSYKPATIAIATKEGDPVASTMES